MNNFTNHTLKFLTLSDLEEKTRVLQHHFLFQQQEMAEQLEDLQINYELRLDKGIIIHVNTLSPEQADRVDLLLDQQHQQTESLVRQLNGDKDEDV